MRRAVGLVVVCRSTTHRVLRDSLWVTRVTSYGNKIHHRGTEILVVWPSYNLGRQRTCSDASQLIRRLDT